MIQVTTAINKINALKKRKKIIQGGTWAGKTYGIIPILINIMTTQLNKKITVVAETIPAIKQGALADFEEIMTMQGAWHDHLMNRTERVFTWPHTKTKIQFSSFDTVGKAKQAGKRDYLFINEGQYISFEIADALMTRTSGDIYIDFNPTFEFWAHTEVEPMDDAELTILNYLDNEALPDTILQDLQQKIKKAETSDYWKNWVNVYVYGQIGSLEGVIFNNWKTIDSIPEDAQFICYGQDYGFTNDPTTLIGCWRWNNKIIWKELIYRKGLVNSELSSLMKQQGVKLNQEVIGDSAEPKTIAELKSYGFNIYGAKKGADSIKFGIQILQELEMLVTSDSINMIKELRNYQWSDKKVNTPIDAFNHCIDPMRYIAQEKLSNRANKPISHRPVQVW